MAIKVVGAEQKEAAQIGDEYRETSEGKVVFYTTANGVGEIVC